MSYTLNDLMDELEDITLRIDQLHADIMQALAERDDIRAKIQTYIPDEDAGVSEKTLQTLIEQNPSVVLARNFPSRSNPDTAYLTEFWSDGTFTCTCKGYEYRKTCRHISLLESEAHCYGIAK